MATTIIFNPTAGSGKARQLMGQLKPWLPSDATVIETEYPGHAVRIAHALRDQEDLTVVSLGGDGTHHEVLNGLMPNPKPVLSILPAGTGNDFVRVLDYPRDPRAMLEVALNGPPRWFDIGQVNDQYFLTVSGVGFDAEVAGWVNQHEKHGRGSWVFLRAILKHLFQYRSQPVSLAYPSHRREDTTFLVAVCNTAYYAGGMKMAPQASPEDGQFHVIWVHQLSRLAVLPLLAQVFRGTHVHHPRVETVITPELTVNGPTHWLIHADGEIVGRLPAHFRIHPRAIRVRTGSSS
jgi:diacylglycerol kinase (ATP)